VTHKGTKNLGKWFCRKGIRGENGDLFIWKPRGGLDLVLFNKKRGGDGEK